MSRELGRYLLDENKCEESAIEQALIIQSCLNRTEGYKPLGQILVENGSLSQQELDRVIIDRKVEFLSATDIFSSLTNDLILYIVEATEEKFIPKSEMVFQQGDSGNSYWLIISGTVRIFRTAEDGTEITISILGPKQGFGETELLTGEPRTTNAEILKPAHFLVIYRECFDKILSIKPELSIEFARDMAKSLSREKINRTQAAASEQAYQRLILEFIPKPPLGLIGRSHHIVGLKKTIAEVGKNKTPVLVSGPYGTDKRSVSWEIHQAGNSLSSPFLVMNAKSSDLRLRGEVDGDFSGQLENEQNSTLFGHLPGALPSAKASRIGLFQAANNGTVVIENVEQLHPRVQGKLADFLRDGWFNPLGDKEPIVSTARVIGCSTKDLKDLVKRQMFNKELYEYFNGQVLKVPSLGRRKKDLRQIVDGLVEHLSKQADISTPGIGKETYSAIMAYDWPGNMKELTEAIRRAVFLKRDGKLMPEDIFINPVTLSGKFSYNLLHIKWFRNFLESRIYPGVFQAATAGFFIFILLSGFLGNQSPDYNVALILTWGLWEPLLFMSALPLARGWCSICPIGPLSSFISRSFGMKFLVTDFVRLNGVYLGGAGIAAIFWAQLATDMTLSPSATAILIAAITVFALIMAVIFERRAWCRFMCPLGKLLGLLARVSFLELRANYGICNNDCPTHECYLNKDNEGGCPVYEKAFLLSTNMNCILCANCIKICKHDSPQINLRLPNAELMDFKKPERELPFLVAIVIGTQLFRGLARSLPEMFALTGQNATGMAGMMLILILFVFMLMRSVESLFKYLSHSRQAHPDMVAMSLLPMVVAFEMAFHIHNMLNMSGLLLPVLGRQLGFDWSNLGFSVPHLYINLFQSIFALIGVITSYTLMKNRVVKYKYLKSTLLSVIWRLVILVPGVLMVAHFLMG